MNKMELNMRNKINLIRLKAFIGNFSTSTLFAIPCFFGILIGLISVWYKDNYLNGQLSLIQMGLLFIITFLMFGFAGLVIIIRQETPLIIITSIQGLPAIIIGIIWTCVCWGFVLISTWRILKLTLFHQLLAGQDMFCQQEIENEWRANRMG